MSSIIHEIEKENYTLSNSEPLALPQFFINNSICFSDKRVNHSNICRLINQDA